MKSQHRSKLVFAVLPVIVVGFEPPINSLSNVRCNVQDIQKFVINAFEVHSSIRDEGSGEWYYPVVTDQQLPNSVTNLVSRTCQEFRALYQALHDLSNHRDVCSELVVVQRNAAYDRLVKFLDNDFKTLAGLNQKVIILQTFFLLFI